MKTLDELKIGDEAYILKINSSDNLKKRLMDLGFVKGNLIKCIHKSPFNNPKAYLIYGSVIALRCDDANKIIVGDYDEYE